MPDDPGRERRLYVRLTRDRCTRDDGGAPCRMPACDIDLKLTGFLQV